ncbi:MAG TPA: cytochrome c, partial [Gemmatimonadales bacterium]|nr:cytochrome c [Gemmatimonadales bacterium]
ELERSLVSRENEYAKIRLAKYPTAWDLLPVFNPPARVVVAADLSDKPTPPAAEEFAPLEISAAARAGDTAALIALGEAAYYRYPVQVVHHFDPALRSPEAAQKYGLWIDPARGVGGLIRVRLPDGSTPISYTCATCHVRAALDGRLEVGLANTRFDIGRITYDHQAAQGYPPSRDLLTWGPGRADVSTPEGTQPIRIPDLRPTKHLLHLQHNATVQHTSPTALAIRLETLLVAANGEKHRPPREATLGLALYLYTLATPPAATAPPAEPTLARGLAVFADRCAACHLPPTFTGPPVPLDRVGADAIGHSKYRGTGSWRVPSLLGVATRGPLLHDASVPNLAALLSDRPAGAPHRFGADLSETARADLIAYVSSL